MLENETTGAFDETVPVDTGVDNESTENVGETTTEDSRTETTNEAEAQAEAALAAEKEEKTPEELAAEALAFKPNIKFKVLDKEMEIPKEFQALMKDKESEKIVRELFEKAEGLPTVKQKLETVRSENQNLSKEVNYHRDVTSKLGTIYQKAMESGNLHKLDDWFKVFNIPENVIVNYALAKVKLAEMDPNQRQMIMGQLDAERNAETQQQQNAELQKNFAKMAAETKSIQLDSQLLNPEYKTAAEIFDARVGKPGAFKDEIRRIGSLAWHTEKLDLTPQQAIDRAIEYHGLKNAVKTGVTQTPAAAASGSTATAIVKKPASTIPNISGGSKSPVTTSKVKNLDELKKLRDQAWGKSS